MAVNPSAFGPKPQFVDGNGNPAVGYKLFSYAAGSSTKQNTYTDSTGNSANTNPIVLNSLGQPTTEIWFTEGSSYKLVLAPANDTDPPASPVWTVDNLLGINDASISIDQWIASGVTPTYVNATQFTLPGDQTTEFQVNRRIKATVTAGTVYGYISVSAYAALTTVTVVLDSGSLDSGLSAVSLGLITPTNTSLPNNYTPPFIDSTALVKGSSDATKLVRLEVDGLTTATTRVLTVQDKDITIAGVSDVNGGIQLGSKIQYIGATVSSNALTITINPTTLDFRSTTLTDGTPTTVDLASAVTVVVPNTATLGTINATAARLAVLAINNAGTIEAAVVNLAGGNQLDETNLISTTAISAAAGSNNVIYSTTARASVAYRVIGFIDITEATAGTWATAPTKVQGSGGQALAALSSLGYGQRWQDVSASRAATTTYYNTTGKPIMVSLYVTISSTRQVEVDGISVAQLPSGIGSGGASVIVPPGSSYRINGSVTTIVLWAELR